MAKVVLGKTLLTYSDYVKIPEDGKHIHFQLPERRQ